MAKFGVDGWALARGSSVEGFQVAVWRLGQTRILPAAALYGALLGLRFPAFSCLAVAMSVYLDAIALIVAAEMSGKGRIRLVAVAHLFRLPLFFMLAVGFAWSRALSIDGLLVLMCISSAARLAVLMRSRIRLAQFSEESPRTGSLVAQQVLNYGLFKNDQLVFSLLPTSMSGSYQAAFVFCARFPELISAAINALGPQLYPQLLRDGRSQTGGLLALRGTWAWGLMFLVALLGAFAFGALASDRVHDQMLMLVAVGCHGAMILPTNVATYRLMRSNDLRLLNAGARIANLVGLSVGLSAVLMKFIEPGHLLWIVPLQQAVFLSLTRASSQHAKQVMAISPK
jgi:hypothetical protein